MTGGGGNDVFVIGNTDSGVITATADIIRDFVSGEDKLNLDVAGNGGNFTTYDSNVVENVASVEEAVLLTDGFFTAGGTPSYRFIYDSVGGTAGYLCADLNGDNATDLVIQLAGVTTAIAAGDII